MLSLTKRVEKIQNLFYEMDGNQASNWQKDLVANFRKEWPELNKDLDFCFEVLAGKHKVGYTADFYCSDNWDEAYNYCTIEEFYQDLKTEDLSEDNIDEKNSICKMEIANFMQKLVNREYRLGYSNKAAMITDKSPMLAKKYPDDHKEQFYYIQEKLDGNRCIAYCEIEIAKEKNILGKYINKPIWKFQSRSGKPLKVNFDMSWADPDVIYDGEIMTLGKAGTRDFSKTSGLINAKYADKSVLHYFIYDIIDPTKPYKERKEMLDLAYCTGKDCSILPTLDKIWLNPNPDYNLALDILLDKIVDQGGEGVMLRDPDATYQIGKRSNALLKYKKVQTMDLRVIDIEPGTGKYEDMIGSLVCMDDDKTILVNVGSGLSDDDRDLDEDYFIGKIVEVAYFDICQSDKKEYKSLRFPRFKGVRHDKSETSTF